jgi:hypothetical protein
MNHYSSIVLGLATRRLLLVVCKVSLSSTFQVMPSANTGKQNVLDIAIKFKIIQACENNNVSNSKIGRHCNLHLSKLFAILKNKDEIKFAV